jgi:ribosomal protein L11 methyltransferase
MTSKHQEWLTIQVIVSDEMEDAISNFFHEQAVGGVLLDEAGPGLTRVTSYVWKEEWKAVRHELEKTIAALGKIFPSSPAPLVRTSPLKHENWAVAWKSGFKAIRVGRGLIVTPPWIKPRDRSRKKIVIDPAEAFGTGTHETTQGCLVLLEESIERLRREHRAITVLDVGCGSGILAIAAVKLGVGEAVGVDNDPVAIASARRNVELNNVQDQVRLECVAAEELTGTWDIVAANLDPLTLKRTGDNLARLFTHFLIVSGVPADQWASAISLFQGSNIPLLKEIVTSEWGCGLFHR